MEVTQMYIYADNAATTKTSQAAIKAVKSVWKIFMEIHQVFIVLDQRAAEKCYFRQEWTWQNA